VDQIEIHVGYDSVGRTGRTESVDYQLLTVNIQYPHVRVPGRATRDKRFIIAWCFGSDTGLSVPGW
jgi:hypothetical protein